MDKQEINKRLRSNHNQFIETVKALSDDEFEYAPDNKWSAGQHAEHLYKSVKPVAGGLGFPKFIVKQKFGKANRPSRSFDELVTRYREKLQEAGNVQAKDYAPDAVPIGKKEKTLKSLSEAVDKLIAKTDKWSEAQMDEYVFPHPLLGKVTVREMLYFTAYHAEHHRRLIKLYLKGV